ncbi:acetyl/propionyl/methylcrotonyl-CoA carboxylase subunit alpha [Fodinicurvata sp. EGI_FJ10296]|uniref:acetyl/propionyl/methylcrotonyl-CoA carboxylase subunit alpha n=1 Tax=Fodinicurvata sp. EGI_FJ10296 TaxID=3231908 RepID=UPI003452C15B
MFTKILIANRGEIACRVIRSARAMGIATVAVYSDADRDAVHVRMADEAVAIGPAPAAESYLVIENIVRACRDTGAEAVHPGYGFLSENTRFAEALAEAGIVFIGPGAEAIAAMGDKITSKKLAAKAGVSTVPGHPDAVADVESAQRIAEEIGFPVMLKASAGGGGKGMRVVNAAAEVVDGFNGATGEARSSFGDDRVFIEKFVEQPRHIEIQVLADTHGNVVYLGERECSIQRRHQKVVEEAPSPFLDAATRKAMGEQAVALARAVGYVSAGTVEFIVDKDRNFYFLEMNTRLQVEHPVTEMVTDTDLVEWMIRIAAGEALSFGQEDVVLRGWAMETRLYAEDPYRGFLPSIGRLTRYRTPPATGTVRIDTGVAEGSEITMYYDPMIAKVVTSGQSRIEAIDAMIGALDRLEVRGIQHNAGFLAQLMLHPRFRAGDMTTNFIAEEFPGGVRPAELNGDALMRVMAVAASVHWRIADRERSLTGRIANTDTPTQSDWAIRINRANLPVIVRRSGGAFTVTVEGQQVLVEDTWRPGLTLWEGSVDGSDVAIQIDRLGIGYRMYHAGAIVDIEVLSPRTAELADLMPVREAPDMSKFLLSPMPGLLVSLMVEEGQQVQVGEALCVVEAMKMENILRAEREGTVTAFHARPGDSLSVDGKIMEFE